VAVGAQMSSVASMLVHAKSRVQLKRGNHSFVAHAELLRIAPGASQLVGTADSEILMTGVVRFAARHRPLS
jgi:hypothetical protein